LAVLLAVGVASNQTRPQSGQAGFPVGLYSGCAQGVHNPSGNEFLNVAGFQDGARLTLARSGSILTSSYVDQNGQTQSLRFSMETDTLATIHEKDQMIPGFTSVCVAGPGKTTGSPANLSVTAGALSYNAGMVFLHLTGVLRSEPGTCNTSLESRASFWVACKNPQSGSVHAVNGPDAVHAKTAPLARFPAGQHSCSTQVETLDNINGVNQYTSGGAKGTLTLTQDGAKVTARYSGDTSLSGTLHLVATTPTAARTEPGQILMAPCRNSTGAGLPSQTPERVAIAAGSLTFINSTLFMSFAGAMESASPCPGAQAAGSVICLK
jgi:hypothetical protein